jgi:hypothetical protein
MLLRIERSVFLRDAVVIESLEVVEIRFELGGAEYECCETHVEIGQLFV